MDIPDLFRFLDILLIAMSLFILYPFGYVIYLVWFQGIHIGKLDTDSWTRQDYKDWYMELYRGHLPLSRKESIIMQIVEGYYNV